MQRGTKSKLIAAIAVASGSLFSANSAEAANYVWQALIAGDASGSWSTATNWNPNLAGGATTTADTVNLATLDITVPSTVTLDGAKSVSVITFGDTDPVNTPASWNINATSSTTNDATDTLTLLTTANPTFNIFAGTTATINATVTNNSTAATTWGLAKGGGGTVALTANNSALTGIIFLNNGTLSLDFNHAWSPVANIIGDTSTGSSAGAHLQLQGGTLNLNGKSGASNSQTFSGAATGTGFTTTAEIGSSSITMTQNGASSLSLGLGVIGRPFVAGAGGISKSLGAVIDITLPTTGTVSGTTPGTGPAGLATDANGSPFITINHGSDWAAATGGNIVAGSSVAGFYTPSTTSTLAGNADLVTNTTLTGATTIATLRDNDTVAHTLDLGGQNMVTGGILVTPTSGGPLTIQNGTLTGPSLAEADMIINQNNVTSPLTISASIINTPSNGALTKTGAGTLILTGNNNYSGDTIVDGGTLSVTAGTLGIVGSPFSCTQIAQANGNTATMNISGGAIVSDDHFDIAGNENNYAGGTGVLNQTGGTIVNGAWFSVGSFGNGTYNFSAGSNTVIGGFASFEVGVFGPGVGTVNMSGSANLILENGSVLTMSDAGSNGNNTVNQNGGTVTLYADGGITPGGAGRLIIGGGGGGIDNYNLNGGTLNVPRVTRTSTTGAGNLNFNGGTLQASASTTAFINGLTAANVQAGGAIIDTQAFNITVIQPLIHSAALGATVDGGLTKKGSGAPPLSGASTYTGPTNITAGTLRLPATGTLPAPTAVGSYSFDTVNGAASVAGTVLEPGNIVNNGGSGGAAMNGTVSNANFQGFGDSGASIVAGKFGNAISFDGTGTSVDVPSTIVNQSGSATWSMSVWVNTATPGGAYVSKDMNGTSWALNDSVFYLAANPPSGTPGSFPTGVRFGGGFEQAGTSVTDSLWHLLTVVDNVGVISNYVDGNLTGTTLTGGGFASDDTSNTVRIGYNVDTLQAQDGNVNFAGLLDELNFYNAALSQQQIQDLFSTNTITHGTTTIGGQLLPSTTPITIPVSGALLDLNGNNQTIGSLTGVSGSLVTLGTGTLTTGGDGTSTTFAGNISGTTGGLTKAGGGTFTLSGTNTYGGNTSVQTGTLALASATALPAGTNLTISGGASAIVLNHGAGPKVLLQVNSLNIATTGTLNLTNNDILVHNGNLGSITTPGSIPNLLSTGFNAHVGYWNGPGIVSTAAANDSRFLTAIGYRSGGSTFDGVSTSSTDVLVKYTYYGDADLSGTVTGADYHQIDLGFGSQGTATPLSGWFNGDFNYDGKIDGSDYALIDNTFNQINALGAGPLALDASSTSLIASSVSVNPSAIPEPTTLSVLAFGAMGLMSRRRRRRCE